MSTDSVPETDGVALSVVRHTASPPPAVQPPAATICRIDDSECIRLSSAGAARDPISEETSASTSVMATAVRGSVNSGRPSFQSVSESVRSIVSSSAPISETHMPDVDREVDEIALDEVDTSRRQATPLPWQPVRPNKCEVETHISQGDNLLPKSRKKLQKRRKTSNESGGSDISLHHSEVRSNYEYESGEICYRTMTLLRLICHGSKWNSVILLFGVTAAFGSAASLCFLNITFGSVVELIVQSDGSSAFDAANDGQLEAQIRQHIICVLYIAGIRLVCCYIVNVCFQVSSIRITAELRKSYLCSLLLHPVSLIDSLPTDWTPTSLTTSSKYIQSGLGEQLQSLVTTSAFIITSMVIAFVYCWQLALMICVGLTPVAVIYAVTVSCISKVLSRVEEDNLACSTIASESFQMIRMLVAFGATDMMKDKYSYWLQKSTTTGFKIGKFVSVQQCLISIVVLCSNSLAFYYGSQLLTWSVIPGIGTIVIVLSSMMLVITSLGAFNQPVQYIVRTADYANFLFTFIDIRAPVTNGMTLIDGISTKDIVLEDVCLRYTTESDSRALDHVSFRIPAGKTTAIIGPPGCGKSTIVNLLERWYELGCLQEPLSHRRSGKVSCGGKPIEGLDLRWWRSKISVVMSEPALFKGTIRENIEYGLVGCNMDQESPESKKNLVERACIESMAMEFISDLPRGLDTVVDDSSEVLTPAQRKQIAIARALVRQPQILILDEATGGLSGRDEILVDSVLSKASQNRTTITTSRRISSASHADHIVVLIKGRVVQEGTHGNLIQDENGPYRILAASQRLNLDGTDTFSRPKTWWRRKSGLVPFMLESFEFAENQQWEQGMKKGLDLMASYVSQASDPATEKPVGLLSICSNIVSQRRELWPWYILLVFSVMTTGCVFAVQAYIFTEQVVNFQTSFQVSDSAVKFWCLMFISLAGASGIGYFFSAWAVTRLSFKLFESLRREYFRNTLSQSILFFDDKLHRVDNLTAAMTVDSDHLQRLLSSSLGVALISLFGVISCAAITLFYSWKLSLITLAAVVPLYIASILAKTQDEICIGKFHASCFDASAQFASDAVKSCRTLSSFGLEEVLLAKYNALLHDQIRQLAKKRFAASVLLSVGDVTPVLWVALVLWYGSKLLQAHEYTAFQFLIVFIVTVQQGILACQWLSFSFDLTHTIEAGKRILSRQTSNVSCKTVKSARSSHLNTEEPLNIEMLGVAFQYPGEDNSALSGINMKIRYGQSVGILGRSGSGKTTLLSILQRLHAPSQGILLINGHASELQNLTVFRSKVTMVSRNGEGMVTGSIRENILLGMCTSDENLWESCIAAGLHEYAMSLPDGYNTRIDSSGFPLPPQQQLQVSLARALIRKPSVLLLDDIMEGLDTEESRNIKAILKAATAGMTVVTASSRVDEVEEADVIYVLQDGFVVEFGEAEDLKRNEGAYGQMRMVEYLEGNVEAALMHLH